MSDRAVILLAVLAPMLTGFATLLMPRMMALPRTLMALLGQAGAFVLLLGLVGRADASSPVGWTYLPELGIDFFFRADRFGLFFGLLVSGMGALITAYAHGYFRGKAEPIGRLLPLMGVFASAMLGVALSDSMFGLFVFWELTTISSFLLIGWNRGQPGSVRSALQAAVITGTGGLALLLGLVVLHDVSGSWLLSELTLGGAPAWKVTLAFVLLTVAAGAKSAQFPVHFWLPGAMAAPTPVSAYLHSATMVKAGVFLLGRVLFAFEDERLWGPVLVVLGGVTMAYAAVHALRGDTIKRVLAYSTVSQLGLFVCMFGLASVEGETLEWPVAQILNHGLYKAPLFMLTGAMAVHAGVNRVDQLGGMARRLPVVGWLFVLGLYAMAAGPGTLSFAAKEFFVVSAHHASEHVWLGWFAIASVVIAAMCNAALLVRLGRRVFGAVEEGAQEVVPGAHRMWWPAALLLAIQVIGGVLPLVVGGAFEAIETHVPEGGHLYSTFELFGKPGLPLAISLGALALGVGLGLSPVLRRTGGDPCERLFPLFHRTLEHVAYVTVNALQSGSIRRYLFVILSVLTGGLLMVMSSDPRWRRMPWVVDLFDARWEIILLSVLAAVFACVAALSLPLTRLRIVRVMVLGAVGYGVTLLYMVNRAPDLALTQIMFEIISVVMFLLVMRMLPERTRADQERPEIARALFAAVVGLVVGWAVFHAAAVPDQQRYRDEVPALAGVEVGAPRAERLGAWFLDNSYEGDAETGGRGGGGSNVVNVILVDFRGYDTMGEITVLAIAMIAVLAMLGPRRLRPARPEADARVPGVWYGAQDRVNSTMLRIAVRVIVPLIFIFAAYVFFKGHNAPGGGFIAGLIASVGIVLYRMAEGRDAFLRLVPVRPGKIIGTGLLIALATGLAPIVYGLATSRVLPFLTSSNEYWELPFFGKYHFTSVMFFDLGVFIVVVGVSVVMINRLEEELE